MGNEAMNAISLSKAYEQIPTTHYLTNRDKNQYYTGNYKLGLNLYSFSHNLTAWIQGDKSAPPVDTLSVIRFAKEAGFDAVDITAYFIPGYEPFSLPGKPLHEILKFVRKIRTLCTDLALDISGTGVKNDFADPDAARRGLDIKRVKYWIDIAAELGAPVIRVFNGEIPDDIISTTWEKIAKERIVPALQACAEYGAEKGIRIGMQNHGDMASTADQVIRILEWADHPNLGVVNDTGCYKTFGARTGEGYAWYDDIEAVLPYTYNFQIKELPGGLHTKTPTDLEELFTRIRFSSYRGYLPLETIWTNSDARHPNKHAEPPYVQVREFLGQIRDAMLRTKIRNRPI